MNIFSRQTRFALAAVLSLSLAPLAALPAFAQELAPEHLALARKYVDLTDKGGLYETTIVSLAIDTLKSLTKLNPDLGDPISVAIDSTVTEYKGRKGDLLDQFARVYALQFSQEELQQIVDFYSSPVGTKLAEKNASLNRNLQAVMKVFQTNLYTEFFAKVRAKLKDKGYTL